jgi:hypothetical protein
MFSRVKAEFKAVGKLFDPVALLGLAFLIWMIYFIATYKGS